MVTTLGRAFAANFLGHSATWYKQAIVAFLIINPILFNYSPFLAGWLLILEFIFTLAMALKCYPLQPGGLLALEAIILGMASPEAVYAESIANFEVIMLLMFMVAGIYFMRDLLLFTFTKILLRVKSKAFLSFLFSITAAFLSAFLDALTVTAVLISVAIGFFSVYHRVASGKHINQSDHDHSQDDEVQEERRAELEQFRSFLRSLIMHGAVGTALGGVCTLVGEPQNLLIAERAGWEFIEFFTRMAPVTMPVLVAGLLTCVFLEKFEWFSYGATLPDSVAKTLAEFDAEQDAERDSRMTMTLIVQATVGVILVLSLAFHVAAVGLVGLMVIVLLTAFNGIIQEHRIGHAFEEALPFTALLVVFFSVVAVIHEQHLFTPVITFVLSQDRDLQPVMFFIANGVLSMISDNVFVATVYINEVAQAFKDGAIDREHFNVLAIAINTGTNLPSVATPNGQAAFLFLLTSALAPLIRLSYMKMLWMALPYTIVLSGVGMLAIYTQF
ncbi:MAG TPA: sodium/proton antiporter NhaB [Gammaproteobacteria bacterium]|nr:sodium/proton antiporter NhaB [Gammaproteobacteria bacterium]